MSAEILEELEIPYFGRTELMHSLHDSLTHGKYWLRTEKCGIVGRFSESPEEAKRKGFEELKLYAQRQRKESAITLNELASAVLFLSENIYLNHNQLLREFN